MPGRPTSELPTRRSVFRMAWPIIVANAAVPTLGLADTAVIGNFGRTADLGAIALGALIFNFLYWSFGFLRMGTTGFTAQASGAGDEPEVRAALARALAIAVVVGTTLILLRVFIGPFALGLLSASHEVEVIALEYFHARIWGAPAALGLFAVMGLLVGLGESRRLLLLQLVLNGSNVLLDVLFAGVLGWGARGIALGTTIAEWGTLLISLTMSAHLLRARHRDASAFLPLDRMRDLQALARTLTANTDIMVRTLFLLLGFAWFTNQSARYGDTVLAANHILLQFLSFAAFFLDGYAFAAESLVGTALGARDRRTFMAAVRGSTELAAGTAFGLALGVITIGPFLTRFLTQHEMVRSTAIHYLPFAALYVFLSFAAFQLDGIYVGATRTREMRNASVVSALVFLASAALLTPHLRNAGLWVSFVVFVVARALALLWTFPRLLDGLDESASQGPG